MCEITKIPPIYILQILSPNPRSCLSTLWLSLFINKQQAAFPLRRRPGPGPATLPLRRRLAPSTLSLQLRLSRRPCTRSAPRSRWPNPFVKASINGDNLKF